MADLDLPIPLAISLDRGYKLATPRASDGTFVLQNNGTNEPVWAAAASISGLQVLDANPLPLIAGTVWVVKEGTSPQAQLILRAYVDGMLIDIARQSY